MSQAEVHRTSDSRGARFTIIAEGDNPSAALRTLAETWDNHVPMDDDPSLMNCMISLEQTWADGDYRYTAVASLGIS